MNPASLPTPPESADEILENVGSQRLRIYETVRRTLDDFEKVAPWKDLYYPPTEADEFIRLQTGLLNLIEEIPYRISEISVRILGDSFELLLSAVSESQLDDSTREMIVGLLEPTAAQEATQSTRMITYEAIDNIAPIGEGQKLLLKWLIDRYSPQPFIELTEDGYEEAIETFPEEILDDSVKQILQNIQFYFDGIHTMTGGDTEKLQARIDLFHQTEGANLSAQERVFTCEIGADLKGKYTSAMMGAAANLMSEGRWNGSEVEPIIFPEKAAEFERNEKLVATLNEVIDAIKRLPEEVPLVELTECWKERRRVDRYALSHLFGFLGSIGKLMKESTRRALYSGDFHQVQLREHRLSNRINELNMIHNKTWEVLDDTDPNIRDYYPQMVDKAVELAAILDVELLKKIIGDDTVKVLLQIVSIEGEKRREQEIRLGNENEADYRTVESIPLREKLPKQLLPLISLLYDEDLQTFLELLLGSVLKRASFSLQRRRAEANEVEVVAPPSDAPAPAPASPAPVVPERVDLEEIIQFEDMTMALGVEPQAPIEVLSEDLLTPLEPAEAVAEDVPTSAPQESAPQQDEENRREKLERLQTLRGDLERLVAGSNAHRRSFDLVHRLLKQKGMIPPSMLQSILPFLEDLSDHLVPHLTAVSAQGDLPITYQSELLQYCRSLARRDLTPQEMKTSVLTQMEGLLSLLGDLEAAILEVTDAYTMGGSGGGFLGAVDDYL